MRKILKERKNLGTSRSQERIAAAIEAAESDETNDRQSQAQKQKGKDYWDNLSLPGDEESHCDGVESIRSSDGQETAPAPSPLNQSDQEVVVVDVTYENEVLPQRREIVQTSEILYGSLDDFSSLRQDLIFIGDDEEIEITYDNTSRKFKIKKEVDEGLNTVPKTLPSTSKARHPTQEKSVTSSREEVARRTPPKDRLGKRSASAGQASPHGTHREQIRRSILPKRTPMLPGLPTEEEL